MDVNGIEPVLNITKVQTQREVNKAEEDRKADENAARIRQEREVETKPEPPKENLDKETRAKNIDVTA